MAKRAYRKDYMTKIKGSANWYLQFYIKPDYRSLPFFKNNPKWDTRRNFLETLKTPNYQEASVRSERRLQEIGIKERPLPPELATGKEAFFSVLRDIKSRDDEELKQLLDAYETLRDNSLSPAVSQTNTLEVQDEVSFDHYSKAVEAVQRELKERNTPFFSQPYPYEITLLQLAEHYRTEIVEDGADNKTQSKLHHAVRKLLEFRGVNDIEVRFIRPKMINDYVRYSKQNDVAEGTMRSELAALSNVWKFGVLNDYIYEGVNPFLNIQLKGFKPKNKRLPFTPEMLPKLLNEAKSDSDLEQLVMCCYYTGMRLSEIFHVDFKFVENNLCFDVAKEGGKTASSPRFIPIHPSLMTWLSERYNIANIRNLMWKRKTADAVGKKFGRMRSKILMQMGINDNKVISKYTHHSFRHGFSTMLLEAGFQEIEMADLTGHERGNMGRTEAGRTYFATQSYSKLYKMIGSIPDIIQEY